MVRDILVQGNQRLETSSWLERVTSRKTLVLDMVLKDGDDGRRERHECQDVQCDYGDVAWKEALKWGLQGW